MALAPGETFEGDTGGSEIAIVPLSGSGWFQFGGATHQVARKDVFSEKPHVAYLPPGTAYSIGAVGAFEVAIGSAPASAITPPGCSRQPNYRALCSSGANARAASA